MADTVSHSPSTPSLHYEEWLHWGCGVLWSEEQCNVSHLASLSLLIRLFDFQPSHGYSNAQLGSPGPCDLILLSLPSLTHPCPVTFPKHQSLPLPLHSPPNTSSRASRILWEASVLLDRFGGVYCGPISRSGPPFILIPWALCTRSHRCAFNLCPTCLLADLTRAVPGFQGCARIPGPS